MLTETSQTKLGVSEYEAAGAVGLSVHTLRKDRQHARRIPYFKVGRSVRYNLDRVREALLTLEVGGPQIKPRRVAR